MAGVSALEFEPKDDQLVVVVALNGSLDDPA